ncbi:Putative flagellar motor protein MotB [Agrobacterium tumefaciens]|nr:Putative flagellar motor protein MotB [Agrobacterium tumefaciens]
MALARNRRRDRGVDYWPGFVDALSTLLMAIMFLLTVFVLAQFVLSREITGKDEVLTRLNSQIAELTELLAMEKGNKQDIEDALASLPIDARSFRKRAFPTAGASRCGIGQQCERQCPDWQPDRRGWTTSGRPISRASAQIELLNQQIAALRAQIASVEAALQASEAKDTSSQVKIADLGRRLNVALAQRVQELNRYRV